VGEGDFTTALNGHVPAQGGASNLDTLLARLLIHKGLSWYPDTGTTGML